MWIYRWVLSNVQGIDNPYIILAVCKDRERKKMLDCIILKFVSMENKSVFMKEKKDIQKFYWPWTNIDHTDKPKFISSIHKFDSCFKRRI